MRLAREFFRVVYMMNYIDGFSYLEPSLHPRNKTYLIVINYGFDMFLDSVCENFFGESLIDIDKGNWSEVLFFCGGVLYVVYI